MTGIFEMIMEWIEHGLLAASIYVNIILLIRCDLLKVQLDTMDERYVWMQERADEWLIKATTRNR